MSSNLANLPQGQRISPAGYVSDIDDMKGTDTQAFGAWEAPPGPFKIVNNYLEAAGENLMFGAVGGPTNKYVPSDIEVRGNYIFKPQSWIPLSIAPINQMVVKNAFELKSAQRVLFDGNTLEMCGRPDKLATQWCSRSARPRAATLR